MPDGSAEIRLTVGGDADQSGLLAMCENLHEDLRASDCKAITRPSGDEAPAGARGEPLITSLAVVLAPIALKGTLGFFCPKLSPFRSAICRAPSRAISKPIFRKARTANPGPPASDRHFDFPYERIPGEVRDGKQVLPNRILNVVQGLCLGGTLRPAPRQARARNRKAFVRRHQHYSVAGNHT